MGVFIFILLVALATSVDSSKSPHIILIIADDLGFNDVSYRGSEDIHTPNIDALGYAGRILDRHYTLPACTPSRSSLLTGRHVVRTGMQGFPLKTGEPRGLPLNFTVLPEYLKRLNYSTHLVGKWHVGSHRWAYTPTYRGFDTFFGYYHGLIGYLSHEVEMSDWPGDRDKTPKGCDLHRNEDLACDLRGHYATELFTSEAEKLIRKHDTDKPLFLQLAQLAPHTGENHIQNEVPDEAANDRLFGFIKDGHRRRYAGSVKALDDSVGRIIRVLAERNILKDSLVVFFGDNGGMTTGRVNNSASNWPLRGQKLSQYEGGVRTPAMVWHKSLPVSLELHRDLFHISDWLPTLYEAAGGNVEHLGQIDGVSHWHRLSGRQNLSTTFPPRTEFLVNSDGDSAYIKDWWKFIIGENDLPESFSKLTGERGLTPGRQTYNFSEVINSQTMKYLLHASEQKSADSLEERAAKIRKLATLPSTCRENATEVFNCSAGCLFNLYDDPCETKNIASDHPDIVSLMLLKLESWKPNIVPKLSTKVDLINSDPRKFGNAWVPWLDVQTKANSSAQTHTIKSSLHVVVIIAVLSWFK